MDSIVCKKCKFPLIEYYLKEITLLYNSNIYSILRPSEYHKNRKKLFVCIYNKRCINIDKYVIDCKIQTNKSIREIHAIKIIQAWCREKLYDYETMFSRRFIAFKLGPEGRKAFKDFINYQIE